MSPTRLTGEARDKERTYLAKRYRQGASIRALAEETGRSYGLVSQLLKEAGVRLRPRGGNHRQPAQKGGEA